MHSRSMVNSVGYWCSMFYGMHCRGRMNRGSVVNSMSYRGRMTRDYWMGWLRMGRMRGFGISMSIDKFLTNLFW